MKKYSVIRTQLDSRRGETINIGVIIFDGDDTRCHMNIITQVHPKLKAMTSGKELQRKRYEERVQTLKEEVDIDNGYTLSTAEEMDAMVEALRIVTGFEFSELTPVVVHENPLKNILKHLFEIYVYKEEHH